MQNTNMADSQDRETRLRFMRINATTSEALAATVAAAPEEASANVQTVASAAEELTASAREISRQVEQSAQPLANWLSRLAKQSDLLKTELNRFLVGVRAA